MSRVRSSLTKIPAKPFVSTWNTANTSTGSSANNQVRLPLISTGTYKFTVYWGDGSSNVITTWNQTETTHTYAAVGTYTITIKGFIKGWDFAGFVVASGLNRDRLKITSITRFGCLRFVSYFDTSATILSGAFYGCTNLNVSGILDQPNFKNTTAIQGFFRDCGALITSVPNVNKWDVSKVQSFRHIFRGNNNFNDNIGNWNMSSATDIGGMFFATSAGKFTNGGSDTIKNWNTSSITDMNSAFYNQPLFNINISSWNVSKVTIFYFTFGNQAAPGTFNQPIGNWDTSSVIDFRAMFQYQPSFDQNLGSWDTSKATLMTQMFYGAYNVPGNFTNGGSPSIANWNVSNVTDMAWIFHAQVKFNQNIGAWNVSKVNSFYYALGSNSPTSPGMLFNNGGSSSINNWNTSLTTDMRNVFRNNPGFNQPLGNWNISNVTSFLNFLQNTNVSVQNYSDTLIGWASRPVKPNISINNGGLKYNSSAVAARAILTSAPNNWTISDGGLQP